jgi:hypothetical protein
MMAVKRTFSVPFGMFAVGDRDMKMDHTQF